jgi:3-deoxy-7-phosphoheptulonate synthase
LVEEARKAFDLGLVSEATEVETFDEVERVADLVQIGARNTLDMSVIPAAKALTHMPITANPSHAA